MKTKFDSYCLNGTAEGCKYCVQGRKLVLFITGKCSRNCVYCSLSKKRKNKDLVWANERQCFSVEDAVQEARDSKAEGVGITGGDPLLFLDRTISFINAFRKNFRNFHIHIYVPTNLVSAEKLKKLKKAGVNEIRFHPKFLENVAEEIKKIKLANLFWKKENIGIELPVFPDKIKETINFIKRVSEHIGFVNLNELEISDTNFDFITKKYKINEDSYTIKDSKEAGLKILKNLENLKLKIHFCTAKTKNLFQYKNRLKLRGILPFGYKTPAGTVKYFVIFLKDLSKNEFNKLKDKKGIFLDEQKKRFILSEEIANQLNNFKIFLVEEFPTFDRTEIQVEPV